MKRIFTGLLITLLISLISACAPMRYPPGYHTSESEGEANLGKGGYVKRGKPYQIEGKWYYPLASGDAYDATGVASWYGKKFHGRQTANGETYNMYAMTAAHTTLPMPSLVLVTNLENGRQVKVRVNDRGPFVKDRLIDLSYAAAKALGYSEQGTTKVRVQTLQSPDFGQQPTTVSQQVTPVHNPLPQAAKAPASIKLAYIQLGAFSARDSADKFVTQLQSLVSNQHPPLNVYEANSLFRVRIGPFDLDADAEKVLVQIKAPGHDSAMIIHD